jgi:histidyl-tRNA synthetase
MSLSRLQDHFTHFGYEYLETPIIEPADLFLTKAGDEIINHLFTFERGGKQLALRPEFTASAARRYVQGVVRWQFSGAIFQESPQGQYQHLSIGAEFIGLSGAGADAEIIGMAASGLINQGVVPQVIIGHAGLMHHLLQSFQIDELTQRFLLNQRGVLKNQGKTYLLELLNRYLPIQETAVIGEENDSPKTTEEMLRILLGDGIRGTILGGRSRDDIVQRLMRKQHRAANRDQILAAVDFLEGWVAIEDHPKSAFEKIEALVAQDDIACKILNEWRQVVDLLEAYGIEQDKITIKADVERTWDYYTGIVFELVLRGDLVGAGGRYDELILLLGGQENTPAVGFTYYVEPLMKHFDSESDSEKLSLVLIDKRYGVDGVRWAQKLRERGFAVRLMPDGRSDDLRVSDDGQTLYWNNKHYSDVETLIADLKL